MFFLFLDFSELAPFAFPQSYARLFILSINDHVDHFFLFSQLTANSHVHGIFEVGCQYVITTSTLTYCRLLFQDSWVTKCFEKGNNNAFVDNN